MSTILQILPDPTPAGDAFHEVEAMRALRRKRRLGDVAWGDLAYRVYTTALGTIVLVIFASGLIGDDPLDTTAVSRLTAEGPGWAGLVAAAMFLVGSRSGHRGGPMAVDSADVHNLLLAPIERWRVLLRPAVGTVGYGSGAVAALGALTGLLLAQRAPGGNPGFISAGIVFGTLAAGIAYGLALLAASRRVDGRVVIALSSLLLAGAVARVAGLVAWTPTDEIGSILFWPLRFTTRSLVVVPVAVAIVWLGIRSLDGISIEQAQRRTRLVGQLRFAVTQQDLRSVLLLRRQLASEHPIGRNRLRRLTDLVGPRFPVLARSLSSIGRWPGIRIVRVLGLGLAAGAASLGVWRGTTPLVVVAGLCSYVAALDVLEPLAQEIDHPMLVDSYPMDRGLLFLHHLVPAALVMFVSMVPGALAAVLVEGTVGSSAVAAVVVATASIAATAGAAVSIVGEAILSATDEAMMPPEVAGPRVVMKTLWPPFIAATGFAPVLGALLAHRAGGDVAQGVMVAALPPAVLAAVVGAWVYYRDEIHRTMSEAMGR